jgi:chaperonin cofactor prefoldin
MIANNFLNKSVSLLDKLQEETQILTNIGFILDKMNKDKFLSEVETLINKIMSNEIIFTINGN